MSDDDQVRELRERIIQLEIQNSEAADKIRILNTLAKEKPTSRPVPNNKHEFSVELTRDNNERLSYAYKVDGVEFYVRLCRQAQVGCEATFFASLVVANITRAQKFALTTMEVGHKNVESSTRGQPYKFTSLCGSVSQNFTLNAGEEEIGTRRTFKMKETYATCAVTIYVRVSITVQTIDLPEPEENDERIVVVKGEDEDISSGDFRELLAVILPSDKPITKNNYMKLLTMAQRFEMPELTRRVECFLIDFDRNEMNRAAVYRIATDLFELKLVQSALIRRWDNLQLLERELVQTHEYDKLSAETKAFVNEKFVQAFKQEDFGHWITYENEEEPGSHRLFGRNVPNGDSYVAAGGTALGAAALIGRRKRDVTDEQRVTAEYRFAAIDSNGDGAISEGEGLAYLMSMESARVKKDVGHDGW
ncbi:hypothetical protein PRIPAC_72315 [Pristionchus pacificus]|uniref:BTB domain-containing protein n=1 Tax=Pristionchus pacificus TaxID=54126 RepID=A0A2A6C0S7_PRIPA|nr:hypothetical protein PRIPAC_72315 [Pristionchus pacificus]|eukprot:PDM71774.1 hypothetical protein PRIPAC_38181 [Pristionchus pacificus]